MPKLREDCLSKEKIQLELGFISLQVEIAPFVKPDEDSTPSALTVIYAKPLITKLFGLLSFISNFNLLVLFPVSGVKLKFNTS